EVDEKESSLHEVVWKKKPELKDFFSVFEGKFLVELLNKEDHIHTGTGLLANSDKFSGMDSESAKKKIIKFVGGKSTNTYRLRDWGISRQRYWGCPIPIVNDPA